MLIRSSDRFRPDRLLHQVRIGNLGYRRVRSGFFHRSGIRKKRGEGRHSLVIFNDVVEPILDIESPHPVHQAESLIRNAALDDMTHHPEIFRVIRNHQEIKRRFDLHPGPVIGMNHGVPLGVAVGRRGIRRIVPVQIGIKGIVRMEMRIPEKELIRLSQSGTGQEQEEKAPRSQRNLQPVAKKRMRVRCQ